MKVECEISLGELIDKISILMIKQKFITDREKKDHAKKEEEALRRQLADLSLKGITPYLEDLIKINTKLWQIEDDIRVKEREKDFGEVFIQLARSVYKVNDQRFFIKNSINQFYGSSIVEVKSYEDFN